MAYTQNDFQKRLAESGLADKFSQWDMDTAMQHPDFGMSILSAKQDYNSAATPEQKLLANGRANGPALRILQRRERREPVHLYGTTAGEDRQQAGGDRFFRFFRLRAGGPQLRQRLRPGAAKTAGFHHQPARLLLEQGDGSPVEQL